ncbi:hypothetical protein [Salmonella sp. s54412]|uniref:hypothetical protein n=1 Tax=unclassified Salmonella TaxID=2614656 RepID=UPI003754E5C0
MQLVSLVHMVKKDYRVKSVSTERLVRTEHLVGMVVMVLMGKLVHQVQQALRVTKAPLEILELMVQQVTRVQWDNQVPWDK